MGFHKPSGLLPDNLSELRADLKQTESLLVLVRKVDNKVLLGKLLKKKERLERDIEREEKRIEGGS